MMPPVSPTHLYFFVALDLNIKKYNALISGLSLNGVIGKILLEFNVKACTSWFAVTFI